MNLTMRRYLYHFLRLNMALGILIFPIISNHCGTDHQARTPSPVIQDDPLFAEGQGAQWSDSRGWSCVHERTPDEFE